MTTLKLANRHSLISLFFYSISGTISGYIVVHFYFESPFLLSLFLPGLLFGLTVGVSNFWNAPLKIFFITCTSMIIWFVFYQLTFFVEGHFCGHDCHDEGYLDRSDFPDFFADFADDYPKLVRGVYYSAIQGYLPAVILLATVEKLKSGEIFKTRSFIIMISATLLIYFSHGYLNPFPGVGNHIIGYILCWQVVVGLILNKFTVNTRT